MSLLADFLELFIAVVTHDEVLPHQELLWNGFLYCSVYISKTTVGKSLLPSPRVFAFVLVVGHVLLPDNAQVHPASLTLSPSCFLFAHAQACQGSVLGALGGRTFHSNILTWLRKSELLNPKDICGLAGRSLLERILSIRQIIPLGPFLIWNHFSQGTIQAVTENGVE